jgi:hypothetical protein
LSDPIVCISVFDTCIPTKAGPALGTMHYLRWSKFAARLQQRRVGVKDGVAFCPASFRANPDGSVRRIDENLTFRSMIVLDVETDKRTGEVPPSPSDAAERCRAGGWAAIVYTSHRHKAEADPRYRIVCPLTETIDPRLDAPEVVARRLDLLGVCDRSRFTPAACFYLPSSSPGALDVHETIAVQGAPIDAAWLTEAADEIQAERDRIESEAHEAAAARRAARTAAGGEASASIIETIRKRFDLETVLLNHGYVHNGRKFRHPNSQSGSYGADIAEFGGIDRVFSHNAGDPLHASNLPAWCGGVKAVEAFDVVVILQFNGDRDRAIRELAERFGLVKAAERRAVAKLIFRLIRKQAPQETIEGAAFAEGERLGLTRGEVCDVARWVVSQKEAA